MHQPRRLPNQTPAQYEDRLLNPPPTGPGHAPSPKCPSSPTGLNPQQRPQTPARDYRTRHFGQAGRPVLLHSQCFDGFDAGGAARGDVARQQRGGR
jgi:hypothetical protein